MVAAVLPPPAQVVAAAAGAVAAVAGAIDTAKSCVGGDVGGCASGIAGMVPGVRQAKNAARGVGALKDTAKGLFQKGCNSFLPGTKVLMADGSAKPIEEVDVDDQVRASDPETGEEGNRPVTALITGNGAKKLVKITVDVDGDEAGDGTVTATDGHPVWVDNQQKWLDAGALKPGMQLLTPDGARVAVIAVVAYGAVATVHNLDVDDIDTYFVVVGGKPVLVHNAEACSILEHRAKELHDLRRDGTATGYFQWKLGTTAIVRTKRTMPDGSVKYVDVVAANGKGLTDAQRAALRPNEREAVNYDDLHAEMNALKHADDKGWEPLHGAASRNVCPWCENSIRDRGGRLFGRSKWRQAVPAANGKKRYPKGQRGFEVKRGGQVIGYKVKGGTLLI
jgi:hypothetical protein